MLYIMFLLDNVFLDWIKFSFSVKSQMLKLFYTCVCHNYSTLYGALAAIGSMSPNECGCVPIKLYLWILNCKCHTFSCTMKYYFFFLSNNFKMQKLFVGLQKQAAHGPQFANPCSRPYSALTSAKALSSKTVTG